MRNALNNLADTVETQNKQPDSKMKWTISFTLFRRYLTEKASGSTLDWDKIRSPSPMKLLNTVT